MKQAGATFIMTPGFEKSIVEECIKQDIAVFPGVFSPGEIMEGIQLGIEIFKVFPAGTLGPTYIKKFERSIP